MAQSPCQEERLFHAIHWLWLRQDRNGRWRQRIIVAMGVMFLLSFSISSRKLLQGMLAKVEAMPKFQATTASLSLKNLPSFLTPYTQEVAPEGFVGSSVMQRETLAAIAAAYRRNPWVEDVQEIKKQYPNKISVSLAVRQPAAWVEHAEGYMLCDMRGVRLPTVSVSPSDLPILTGISTLLPSVGQQWQGSLVPMGISLIRTLKQNGLLQSLQISQVQFANSQKNSNSVSLICHLPHLLVSWGHISEDLVSWRQKIHALKTIESTWESWDMNELEYVDIRFGYPILHNREAKWKRTNSRKRTS